MFKLRISLLACACALALASALTGVYAEQAQTVFPLDRESKERASGVVAGDTLQFMWDRSEIFPGTQRTVSVYVPRAYDGKSPACVAIFQDKGNFNFEIVFDNLIHSREMPVTIAVVVPPGTVPGRVDISGTRYNRTFEYDSPGDRYARFLLEEILPAVERLKASDGRMIRLSHDGKDRMVVGGSSGAAGAFNAAWARPDEFSRVFSAIGSYTGLRGSYASSTLVQKTEPKALRLFLQSGTHDMWTAFGDWWSANNAMVRALTFAGYEFKHEFGEGKHSTDHGAALFPRAVRFLWQGWPEPVKAGVNSRNHALRQALIQNQRWVALPASFSGTYRIRPDVTGRLVVSAPNGAIQLDSAGKMHGDLGTRASVWGFSRGGKSFLTSDAAGEVSQRGPAGAVSSLATALQVQSMVATASGPIYAAGDNRLWLLGENRAPRVVDEGPVDVGALAVSGDGNWLAAFERTTARGFSYRIENDGQLSYKQTFYVLHQRDQDDHPHTRDAVGEASQYGYIYVATALGVQICDANGRCVAIVPLPGSIAAVSICFGGDDFKTLYVLGADGKIYSRPTRTPGAAPFRPSVSITTRAG